MPFKKKDRIVFIGDSITDKGRKKDPLKLGSGYVRMIHDYLTAVYPQLSLKIINEGVSGNRVIDLEKRWTLDVIDHQPQWVSISIGINDVWRQLDSPMGEQVYPDKFEDVYRNLLDQTKQIPDCRLILMQPTVIKEYPDATGNRLLKPYVDIVNRLAEQYDALLVPTHLAFIDFLKLETGQDLTTDGVHMNSLGDTLMATTWLKAVEGR
ncbi:MULTISPECIES: SGNH/GDSL hydrolase family protein [Paenibacillus]|uniref:SGNH/GDSL hydrolase family protein n=1 Tax=Paenibacillus violae TaxID=3077234 RepID=A0ABU3R604_9BACL|nr:MULTISPECIES: SGNH/GDSL hydrolase family protein [Paenibacillus]MDU0199533.1 SGNH/GDSL hydrolase family protein [Paenibacillus sp. PFR10]MEC0269485.1 SGNH/GDSL hydrolase family protein [Paenibacillus anseongense]